VKPNPLTQHVTVRARFLKRVVRTYLGSDDFRWRVLVTTSRYTSHIAIIIVALIAMLLAGAHLGGEAPTFEPEVTLNGSTSGAVASTQIGAGGGRIYSPDELQTYLSVLNQDSGLLSRRAIAETSAPVETRGGIITYTVQAGDTIETIAARFKLLPSTLVWSNQEVENQPDQLSIGQVLYILPVDGIWYEVQSDDTIGDIADKYKVTSEDIVNYPLNNLGGGANLLAGTKIVIPNGVKAAAVAAVASSSSGGYSSYGSSAAANPAASGNFMWPTQGSLTQYFGVYHSGIDIAYAVGIPIAAADGGYVSYAGWDNTGYGYEVLINHGNGFTTRYAHLSQFYVDAGQPVARGQVIAAMGSTGNSTGPHLHFEVIYGGVPQNPLFYLP
jgi:murein DD-endopeptidase MepM/ murein hydrolase activator NlpD